MSSQDRQHCSRSHHAVIRVYDAVGNVIETHEHKRGRIQAPTGFAKSVGDDFPILHVGGFCLFCSSRGNDFLHSTSTFLA
jgi:hypothetical protein